MRVEADSSYEVTVIRKEDDGDATRREEIRVRRVGVPLLGSEGKAIGRMLLVPAPPSAFPPRRDFLHSVNRWLLGAVLGAGLLALASTAWMARRMLHPIEELTSIAREMERGDLSRRASVRTKDEIGELARSWNAMADGLARIERLRRGMVEDVAHELRTPLTRIRGQLESVQDGLLPADRDLIDSLHEEVMGLSHLVSNLQDLALAEAGQLRLVPRLISIAEEVERVLRSLPPPASGMASVEGPPAPIVLDLPAEGLPGAHVDPERFRQIVRNLVENALAHTPPGGRITITARQAQDGEIDGRRAIEIEVADTGEGIPAEDLPFVFERFYRADPSRQRATGGAGLGLAIARQLVEAHGGSIRAWSEPGAGARFLFTVPAAASASASA